MNPMAANILGSLASSPLQPNIRARVQAWLESWDITDDLCKELQGYCDNSNWTALTDAFFQDLSFGTGGLRGIVGAGTNRMNTVAVQRVAQGLAHFMTTELPRERHKVAIAYDSRLWSKPFALACAEVLAAANIKVYLFDEVETTPGLSFAVRHLQCGIGLCLTASHNPPEYAGLKVYSDDGAQVVPPMDAAILKAVRAVVNRKDIQSMSLDSARQAQRVLPVPDNVMASYIQAVRELQTFPNRPRSIRVAFTPLHGTGAKPAKQIMADWGFQSFSVVPEQEAPDGRFPTVRKPNPEEPAALKLLVEHAQKIVADVGFATDPDSDRLALVSREPEDMRAVFADQCLHNYVLLNGNQTGALLLSFLLPAWRKSGRLQPGSSVIKTIVTSELHQKLCQENDVHVFNTLTGFKWIAALVREWEKQDSQFQYIFGTEESFGYMPGSYVRDKDGLAALAMAAEMVDSLKKEQRTPCQALLELFARHGAWREELETIDLEGKTGQERTVAIMHSFRSNPPEAIAGVRVQAVEDYSDNTVRMRSPQAPFFGESKPLGNLPPSDVLIFRMEDGAQISVRPSGTEPKIKFYYSVVRREHKDPVADYRAACAATQAYRHAIGQLVAAVG